MHYLARLITDMGDSGILLLTVIFSVIAYWRSAKYAAVLVGLSFAFAVMGIAIVKLAFLGCHAVFHWLDIRSPSGHAALSLAVYGAYARLAAKITTRSGRIASAFFILLALAVAITRVSMGFHSLAEMLVGASIGFMAQLLAHIICNRTMPAPALSMERLCFPWLLAVVLLHGIRLPAELWIGRLSTLLGGSIRFCH